MIYETELYHHGVKGMKWGVKRQSKQAARAYYRAQNNKMGASDSITKLGRSINAKRYDKNMKKYNDLSNKIGEQNVSYGKEKVAGFRKNASKLTAGLNSVGKYVGVGSSIVTAVAGVTLTAMNPALAPAGAALVAQSLAGGASSVIGAKTTAPSISRTRNYYQNEYLKNRS